MTQGNIHFILLMWMLAMIAIGIKRNRKDK